MGGGYVLIHMICGRTQYNYNFVVFFSKGNTYLQPKRGHSYNLNNNINMTLPEIINVTPKYPPSVSPSHLAP